MPYRASASGWFRSVARLTITLSAVFGALGAGCSSELSGEGGPALEGESEDGIRDANGIENVTSTFDTFLKVSPTDSSSLGPADKCRIPKGAKVALKAARAEGAHMTGKLMSAHGCGGKFGGGAEVFVFREHFSGWSAPRSAKLEIVDDPDNYAASCQYQSANRSGAQIKRIVLHNTEGYWSSFKSTWQRCGRIGAAHYVILRNGSVLRTIPERNVAYHAIGANQDSIGVEIESGPGFEGMSSAQEVAVVSLTKSLQGKYGIPRPGITMHRLAAPGTTDCAKYIWPSDSAFTGWRERAF